MVIDNTHEAIKSNPRRRAVARIGSTARSISLLNDRDNFRTFVKLSSLYAAYCTYLEPTDNLYRDFSNFGVLSPTL